MGLYGTLLDRRGPAFRNGMRGADKQIRWTYEHYFNLLVIIMWTLIIYHILNTILIIFNLIIWVLSHFVTYKTYIPIWTFGGRLTMKFWGTFQTKRIFQGHRLLGTKLSPKLLVPSCRFHIAGLQIKNHGKIDIQNHPWKFQRCTKISKYIQIHPINPYDWCFFLLRNFHRHVPSGNLT